MGGINLETPREMTPAAKEGLSFETFIEPGIYRGATKSSSLRHPARTVAVEAAERLENVRLGLQEPRESLPGIVAAARLLHFVRSV